VLQERASAIAIADGAEYCTYSQLDEQSGRLAGWLRENGVEGGGRVGIALERSIGMVATMLGVLKAGCAFVPMDPEAARDRLNVMVADAELSLVVTNRTTVRKMPAGVAILSIEDLPDHVAAAPDAGITAESAACVLYPASRQALVGVDISHRAIVRLACNAACGPFGVEEVFAQVPGAAFDAQLFEIFGALLNGARLAMLPGEATHGPAAFAHAIQECRISTLLLASPTFDSIAASHPAAFHSLRNLLVAGEAIDPRWACHVLKTAPPQRLTRIYGTAEATFALAHEIREVAEDATVLPVGRPAPGARAFVLDWNMRPVPVGVAGELYIGGDALAAGYWGNPELTEERFVASPFDPTGTLLYKTGELARYHANGVIERIVNTDAPVRIPATKSDRSKLILRLTRSAGAGR